MRRASSFSLNVAYLVSFLLVGPLATGALAFDPYPWAQDSDSGVSATQFCLTDDGDALWNDEARETALESGQRWMNGVPGLTVTMDNTPSGDCLLQAARIEMWWSDCWPFETANQIFAFTKPHFYALPLTVSDGTEFIEFIKYTNCDKTDLINWHYTNDSAPGGLQYDFDSLVLHELGHAMGLHHPEGATILNIHEPDTALYPWYSYDTYAPIMEQGGIDIGTTEGRILRQDDVSGGFWIKTRQILARPNKTDFWGSFQGNVLDGGSYLILTKNSGLPAGEDYSYMFMTTRFSTDGRTDRQTPTLAITWRETNGQSSGPNDRVRLRIRWNSVLSYADGGVNRGGGTTPSYIWGDMCYDTHQDGTWEQCQTTFNIGDFKVQDIRVFIYNSTDGRIQLNKINLNDGD